MSNLRQYRTTKIYHSPTPKDFDNVVQCYLNPNDGEWYADGWRIRWNDTSGWYHVRDPRTLDRIRDPYIGSAAQQADTEASRAARAAAEANDQRAARHRLQRMR